MAALRDLATDHIVASSRFGLSSAALSDAHLSRDAAIKLLGEPNSAIYGAATAMCASAFVRLCPDALAQSTFGGSRRVAVALVRGQECAVKRA